MASGDLQRRTHEERLTPTIFALATGAPPTAIAIIRVSGPDAFSVADRLTRRPLPPIRALTRRVIADPDTGALIDEAMIAAFAAPASATGDDLVELHVHGGVAVVAATLSALRRLGAVPAAAGALTRRAFDNGKLDLGQVEALGDLIAAETDGQRIAALARTGSGLGQRVGAWRAELLAVRSDVEASLDFADEDDVAPGSTERNRQRLAAVREELVLARAEAVRGGRLRDGVTVAIVGPVNAGKSTLLNALARRDAALVSTQPGTTRDVIEVRIDLGGIAVTFLDTAGVRETADPLEAEGIRRGAARAGLADILVSLGPGDRSDAIVVVNKCDLTGIPAGWHDDGLHLSATTGDGIDLLEAHIAARIVAALQPGDPPLIAHDWQIAALDAALADLCAAGLAADPVIAAEELRRAGTNLERLIGRITADGLLDSIFARFCIGK